MMKRTGFGFEIKSRDASMWTMLVLSICAATVSGCCSVFCPCPPCPTPTPCPTPPPPASAPDEAVSFVYRDKCVVVSDSCKWSGLSASGRLEPTKLEVHKGDRVVFVNHTECKLNLTFAQNLFVEGKDQSIDAGKVLVLTVSSNPPVETYYTLTTTPATCATNLPGPSIIVQD